MKLSFCLSLFTVPLGPFEPRKQTRFHEFSAFIERIVSDIQACKGPLQSRIRNRLVHRGTVCESRSMYSLGVKDHEVGRNVGGGSLDENQLKIR